MRRDTEPVGAFMDKINVLSRKELEHQLPLAQNSLEAIELELEELMALRDANVIRVAAMTARLAVLEDPSFRKTEAAPAAP
jgi:hypothetical protein